jgi:DeoR/GlpR family transcriptional regulator of sugar metabolism
MIDAGRQVILVADNSKFYKLGLAFICEISDVDMILTDDQVNKDLITRLQDRGVTVKLA